MAGLLLHHASILPVSLSVLHVGLPYPRVAAADTATLEVMEDCPLTRMK
jgi:hypothetical protein